MRELTEEYRGMAVCVWVSVFLWPVCDAMQRVRDANSLRVAFLMSILIIWRRRQTYNPSIGGRAQGDGMMSVGVGVFMWCVCDAPQRVCNVH